MDRHDGIMPALADRILATLVTEVPLNSRTPARGVTDASKNCAGYRNHCGP